MGLSRDNREFYFYYFLALRHADLPLDLSIGQADFSQPYILAANFGI